MQCPSLAQNSFFFSPYRALHSLLCRPQFQAVLPAPLGPWLSQGYGQ